MPQEIDRKGYECLWRPQEQSGNMSVSLKYIFPLCLPGSTPLGNSRNRLFCGRQFLMWLSTCYNTVNMNTPHATVVLVHKAHGESNTADLPHILCLSLNQGCPSPVRGCSWAGFSFLPGGHPITWAPMFVGGSILCLVGQKTHPSPWGPDLGPQLSKDGGIGFLNAPACNLAFRSLLIMWIRGEEQ